MARVVLSHVHGAAFVREEAKGNPGTVLSHMPCLADLAEIANELGLELVDDGGTDAVLERFYLVALQLQA